MYAIINISGKQYKVTKGDRLRVAHLQAKVGDKVKFDNVLLTDDGNKVNIGKPHVKGASVSAEILKHGRLRKILVYKKKRRKGYQRKKGHRQEFSAIKINNISISTTTKKETIAKKPSAAKKNSAPAKSKKKETK